MASGQWEQPKEPGYEGLAVAIVEQAVDDWRYLCNGGKETGLCNYGELQYFIEHDAKAYLSAEVSTGAILEKLFKERDSEKLT